MPNDGLLNSVSYKHYLSNTSLVCNKLTASWLNVYSETGKVVHLLPSSTSHQSSLVTCHFLVTATVTQFQLAHLEWWSKQNKLLVQDK